MEEAKTMMPYYCWSQNMKAGETITIWTVRLILSEVYFWQTYDHKGNLIKEELNVKEINQYKTKNGIVKAGRDRNGNEIIVRQCSSHNGYPTLERQIKRNNTTIKYEKIRYR